MKKISVIIAVYNCEEYLEECLDSVVNQTMDKQDIEVIIINDGSTDNSYEMIKQYGSLNKDWIIINQENKGLSASRNRGLDIATGKYVTFFDSDDILLEDALLNMYTEAEKNNSDVGLFRTINFNSKTTYEDSYTKLFKTIKSPTTLSESKELSSFIRSVAILYKMDIIKNIRFIEKVVHEDNYFCIKAYSTAKNIYLSKKVVYKIRKREGDNLSITQKLNINTYKDLLKNQIKADLEIRDKSIALKHANQLFGYLNTYVSDVDLYLGLQLLYDFLIQIKEKRIINKFEYLKTKTYIQLKCFRKIYIRMLKKKLKMTYLSFLTLISPKLNTKRFYKRRLNKKIDLKKPTTFNEKVQWLKLNYLYPNKIVTKCADKVEVREYIKELGLEDILIDVIGIYDKVEDIDFSKLPEKFVLKWNFGCGYNIICTDKNELNIRVTNKLLKKWGRSKFHLHNAELHYKDIKKKIICEKFLQPEEGMLPVDYKFYCFNGKAEYVMMCYDRGKKDTKFYLFDRQWELARINKRGKEAPDGFTVDKPSNMDKMFEVADKLSKGFPFVRVDLYSTLNKIYFGELTFTPAAGLDTGYTDEGLKILGDKINIEEIKNDKNRIYNK